MNEEITLVFWTRLNLIFLWKDTDGKSVEGEYIELVGFVV